MNFYWHIIDAFLPHPARAVDLKTAIKSKLFRAAFFPQEVMLIMPRKAHPLLHTSAFLLSPQDCLLSDSVPPYCDSVWVVEGVWLDTEAGHTSETFFPHRNLIPVFRKGIKPPRDPCVE